MGKGNLEPCSDKWRNHMGGVFPTQFGLSMFFQPACVQWKRSPASEHTNFTTVCCHLQNWKACTLLQLTDREMKYYRTQNRHLRDSTCNQSPAVTEEDEGMTLLAFGQCQTTTCYYCDEVPEIAPVPSTLWPH